jgi:hypothetical protein
MSEEKEIINEKTEQEAQSDKEAPVMATYSLIKNDIWDAYHQFNTEFGVMVGLRDMDRERSKEYKLARARALTFAAQFHGKIINNFPDVWNTIRAQDKNRYSEERIKEYGDDVSNYLELLNRVKVGIQDKKGNYNKYKPVYSHIAFLEGFMSRFLYVAGITKIEGMYKAPEEKSIHGYGV